MMEPTNYQWMAFLGDAYKFIPGKKDKADFFFESVIKYAYEDIDRNKNIATSYLYLARAYAYFNDFANANQMLDMADDLGGHGLEFYYSGLRVAVLEKDEQKVKKYVECLLETEYSANVLLSDPDFSVLQGKEYKSLFQNSY